jgi:hypothetical protein
MKHGISISSLLLVVTVVASPTMADTLIDWYLNGNVLSDNNTPLSGFFTWDATTSGLAGLASLRRQFGRP